MMREELIEAMARAIWSCDTYRPVGWEAGLRSALTAHDEWLKANGMVVVPVKPTEQMTNASWKLAGGQSITAQAKDHSKQCQAYKAMIEAAP